MQLKGAELIESCQKYTVLAVFLFVINVVWLKLCTKQQFFLTNCDATFVSKKTLRLLFHRAIFRFSKRVPSLKHST